MSMKDDGGPAFPSPEWSDAHGTVVPQEYGMTLRDYFEAHAPNPPEGWMPTYQSRSGDLHAAAKAQAIWRRLYADEMLKARSA